MRPGSLLVVATPLGNLQDVTPRALEALRGAALVACEDTRRTRGLLEHLGIRAARLLSCHKFNERRRCEEVLEVLRRGGDVALVSDGGTPGLSDPGALLVQEALAAGLPVSPIPGPSAVAAAVSVSGFPASSFLFVGFLPARASERRRALEGLRDERAPLVLFEAPHRAAASAADLLAMLDDRPVTVLRELTKMHEEVRRTTLAALAERLALEPARGELTLVVQGAPEADLRRRSPPPGAELRKRFEALLAQGIDRRRALKTLAAESGLSRSEVYRAVSQGTPGPRAGS